MKKLFPIHSSSRVFNAQDSRMTNGTNFELKTEGAHYKNIAFLRRFMTEQGKILSRRSTGISAKEQRKISKAIKQARLLGLLQFVHTR